MSKEVKAALPGLVDVLVQFPDNQHVDIAPRGNEIWIDAICHTQAQVKRVRSVFPGVTWRKKFSAGNLNWWEYHGEWNGFKLKIYGCEEAPPTCHMVKREEMVEEQVPVAFETRMVPKKIIEWKCDGEEAEA